MFFFEDDVQLAHTTNCASCSEARVVEFIHGVTIAGNATIIY